MKKLAVLALLAQTAQPMLTDERVEPACRLRRSPIGDVALGAARAVRAVARLKGFADWAVGRQANLVRLLQERRETEGIRLRGMVEDCGRRAVCCGGSRSGFCRHGGRACVGFVRSQVGRLSSPFGRD